MFMNVGTCNATLLSRSESAHPVLLLSVLKCGLSAQSERELVTAYEKCILQNRLFISGTAVKHVMGQMSTMVILHRPYYVNNNT